MPRRTCPAGAFWIGSWEPAWVDFWSRSSIPWSPTGFPPESAEASANSAVLALNPLDIPPNSGHIFKFGSKPGILVRTPEGELRAFSARCTHLDCTVQYRDDVKHIWCACHNGHSDLNGRNIAGPPPTPLESFDVNVRGTQIVVSRKA